MSETRQVWKPWRANTLTAASRITRRLSTAGAFTRGPPTARGRPRPGGSRATAASCGCGPGGRSRGPRARPSPCRAPGRARPPAGADPGRRLADLVRRDDEALVLDRPRAQEDLPVVARRRLGERGRDGDHRRALDGEDPRQLGEAEVVADRQPELRAIRELRRDRLVSRRLVLGLAVRAAADLDV